MINIFKRKKREGCPVCFENNTIGFGTDYLESKFISRIEKEQEIGGIEIFKCQKCSTQFYKEGNMFNKIMDGQIDTLKRWTNKTLKTDDSLKKKIDEIGFSENWDGSKVAPAKILLNNGKEFDFATIRITKTPPIGAFFDNFENLFFIDEVESIDKSQFGLSSEIRNEANKAEERRMGFYPTVLKTNDGKRIVVNGTSLFFNSNGIKGEQLILAKEDWDHRAKYIYEDKIENQTLIVGKE